MRRKKTAFPVIPLITKEKGGNITTPMRKKTRKTNMATMNMTMKKTTMNTKKTMKNTKKMMTNTKKTMKNIATKNA